MHGELIDITRTVSSEIAVWPGAKPFEMIRKKSFDRGDRLTESEVYFNLHTGTHMDAPLHFVKGGHDIAAVDISKMIGRAQVVEFKEDGPITKSFVDGLEISDGIKKILFKTKNSQQDEKSFNNMFIALEGEAAKSLADRCFEVVGIDGPSVQIFKDKNDLAHTSLLGAGVIVMESLILKNVEEGIYFLVALPLKIEGAEGSPIRAILYKNEGEIRK